MTRFQFVLLSVLCASIPLTAQAKLDLYNPKKQYGDEGATPANPVSRCTGAAFQKIHTDAAARAKKEYEALKAQGKVNAEILERAYTKYEQDLAIGWDAMQEPYCGFGAFGTTAAQKSYKKTVADAQKKFLDNVKASSAKEIALDVTSKNTVSVASAPSPAAAPASVPPAPAVTRSMEKVETHHAKLTRLLKRGMRNDEVKRVQEILIKDGLLEADSATGYFGNMTEAALMKFQLKHKLIDSEEAPGAGWVGPKTRAELEK